MAMACTLSTSRTLVLAVTAGFAIANTFTLQPLLPEILRGFGAAPAAAGWLASAAPLGYTLGMILLGPLGDRHDLGRVITGQLLVLSLAIAAAAAAPSLALLAAAAVMVGLMATAAAQCAAYGARHAGLRRGHVIGTIATGVSIGILLGRTLGGTIGQAFGWRVMEGIMAAGAFGVALATRRLLPRDPSAPTAANYAGLLRSIPATLTDSPTLRFTTLAGSAWFCMFSALWPCLALHLAAPPLGYGPAAAGSFGLVGVAGAVAARSGGRATDRFGLRQVIVASLACVAAGLSAMVLFATSLAALVLGMLLVDVGCFAAQAANQVRVLSLGGAGRNAAYSAYMFCYYTAGTLGALAGPAIYGACGWRMLIAVGLTSTFVAALSVLASPRDEDDHHAVAVSS